MEKSQLKEFTEESSMHGVRHLTDERKSRFTRVLWLCTVMASVFGLLVMSASAYLKWHSNPEIGLRVNHKPILELPFPAVTICNPVFARDNLANFSKIARALRFPNSSLDFTSEEQNYFAARSHTCIPSLMKKIETVFANRTDFDLIKLINVSSLLTGDFLKSCTFRGKIFACNKTFTRVLSNYGYCFTYNMLNHNRLFNTDVISSDFDTYIKNKIEFGSNDTMGWSLDGGYSKKNQTKRFPARATKQNILSFYAYLNDTDAQNNCQQIGRIYPMYLHLPNEIPTMLHEEILLEYANRKTITLAVKSYTTHHSLKRYAPEKRGCYFEGERQLKFFKSYTKIHCDFECLTNETLQECGCVTHSMPRTNDTKVCDVDKADCFQGVFIYFPKNGDKADRPCGCMDTCNYIQYSVKSFKDMKVEDYRDLAPTQQKRNGVYTYFAIQTRQYAIEEYENFAAYGIQNFIADIGGLLGLFMGCSIISLIELSFFVVNGGIKEIRTKIAEKLRTRRYMNNVTNPRPVQM